MIFQEMRKTKSDDFLFVLRLQFVVDPAGLSFPNNIKQQINNFMLKILVLSEDQRDSFTFAPINPRMSNKRRSLTSHRISEKHSILLSSSSGA